ncbi:hypothetical protein LTR85_000129 [Meristemomyces frigidus]|nr:hypothetical protein LTR85_000129 [Meristemomyces frigidus]
MRSHRAGRTHYRERTLPRFPGLDRATNGADDAGDDEYSSTEEEDAEEELSPINREIERLKRPFRDAHLLYRKAYPKHSIEKVQLPEIDLTQLANRFIKAGPGEVGDEKLLRCLVSYEVLPLLSEWLWKVIDSRQIETVVADAFCHGEVFPAGVEGKMMVAAHAYKYGLQHVHLDSLGLAHNWRAVVLGMCARYAERIYKSCELVNTVNWRHPNPAYGHHVCLCIMLTAYNDLVANQEDGFFGTLLVSPLRYAMPRKVRTKWEAKYILPRIEVEEELCEDEEMKLTDKETLIFLVAYKDAVAKTESAAKKGGRPAQGIDWQDVADVLPGCTAADCRWFFEENNELFLDPATEELQSVVPGLKRPVETLQDTDSSDDDVPLMKRIKKYRPTGVDEKKRLGQEYTHMSQEQEKGPRDVHKRSADEVEELFCSMNRKAGVPTVSEAGARPQHEARTGKKAVSLSNADGRVGHEVVDISSDDESSAPSQDDPNGELDAQGSVAAGDDAEHNATEDSDAQIEAQLAHKLEEDRGEQRERIAERRAKQILAGTWDRLSSEEDIDPDRIGYDTLEGDDSRDDPYERLAEPKAEVRFWQESSVHWMDVNDESNIRHIEASQQEAEAHQAEMARIHAQVAPRDGLDYELVKTVIASKRTIRLETARTNETQAHNRLRWAEEKLAKAEARIDKLERTAKWREDLYAQQCPTEALLSDQVDNLQQETETDFKANFGESQRSRLRMNTVNDELRAEADGKIDYATHILMHEELHKSGAKVESQRREIEQLKAALGQEKTARDELKATRDQQDSAQAQLLRNARQEIKEILQKAAEEKNELLHKAAEEVRGLNDSMSAEDKSAKETIAKRDKVVKKLKAENARLAERTQELEARTWVYKPAEDYVNPRVQAKEMEEKVWNRNR